jgi:signal recognition particle subunit SRP54
MFEKISDKLSRTFQSLTGFGKISTETLDTTLKEVKTALLEADVNYTVVQNFLVEIREKVQTGPLDMRLPASQKIINVVLESLTDLMGTTAEGLIFSGPPPLTILLVGLQGSGKTTTAAKLAYLLKKQGKRPFLVPADVARPAAITQLQVLGREINVPVYPSTTNMTPVEISQLAVTQARTNGHDVVLIDTAGRLSIDTALMTELKKVKEAVQAREILLVVDAMIGQEAVNVAKHFNDLLNLTGVILSKMEGDARGGAAMAMRAIIKKPIKFLGTGEKIDTLEPFHPDRIASLILGMGDILTLIEKAEETATDDELSGKLFQRMQKGEFNFDDFRNQILRMQKIGNTESLLSMIPFFGKLKKMKQALPDDRDMKKVLSIIESMTKEERLKPALLKNPDRKKRIAKGSGHSLLEVSQFLNNFENVQKMIKKAFKGGNMSPGFLKNLVDGF